MAVRAMAVAMLLSLPAAARDLDDVIAGAAANHGLPVELVRAVVEVESAYRSDAVSPKGAMGLMQLMPATARELGVVAPFEPAENVAGGCRYLRQLWDRFGDLALALAAYNAGPGAVEAAGGFPEIQETREYVARVLGAYRGSNWRAHRLTPLAVTAAKPVEGILVRFEAGGETSSILAWGEQ